MLTILFSNLLWKEFPIVLQKKKMFIYIFFHLSSPFQLVQGETHALFWKWHFPIIFFLISCRSSLWYAVGKIVPYKIIPIFLFFLLVGVLGFIKILTMLRRVALLPSLRSSGRFWQVSDVAGSHPCMYENERTGNGDPPVNRVQLGRILDLVS